MYRCTEQEYLALRTALTSDLRGVTLLDHAAAHTTWFFPSFVLYAAEWFRRDFDGGNWDWLQPFRSLQVESEEASRIHLCDENLVRAFKYWGRPIIEHGRRRRFLWSVVREGGLPVQKLIAQGGQEAFFTLLRDLLDARWGSASIDLMVLAQEHRERLPFILRDDAILKNLCQLVVHLSSFHERLKKGHGRQLLSEASFIDQLPFVMEGEHASQLAQKLVSVGESAAQQLKAGRVTYDLLLVEQAGVHSLTGEVGLPGRLAPSDLGLAHPQSGRLYLQAGTERIKLADFDPEPSERLLLRARVNPFRLPAAVVGKQLSLVAVCEGAGTHLVPLFDPSELPWVFRREEDEQWHYVGAAPRRLKAPVLRVLLPPEYATFSATKISDATLEGRGLYEVRERASFTLGADEVVVEPGSREDERGEYVVRGERSELVADGWRGPPRVFHRVDGVDEPQQARWHGDGRAAETPLSDASHGSGWIVVRSGREVKFRKHTVIIPRSATVRPVVRPDRRPALSFQGFGAARFRTLDGGEDRGGLLGPLTATPGTRIALTATWDDGSKASLRVLVPGKAHLFRSVTGEVLRSGTELTIRELRGATAEVWGVPGDRFAVSVQLTKNQVPQPEPRFVLLLADVGDHHALSLDQVEPAVKTLFSGSSSPDAIVTVTLGVDRGAAIPKLQLVLRRYPRSLKPYRSGKQIELTGHQHPGDIEVRAQPLTEPLSEGFPLRRDTPLLWSYDDPRITKGPWLMSAWDGSVQRYRPLLITQREGQEEPVEGVALLGAVRIEDAAERSAAFQRVFDLLEQDPVAHQVEWNALNGYLMKLGQLPAPTFAVLAELVKRPVLCALALLRCHDTNSRLRILHGLEELPFMWHLVSLEDWSQAFSLVRNEYLQLEKALDRKDLTPDFRRLFEEHGRGIASADPQYAALERVFERVAVHLRLREERVPVPSPSALKAHADQVFREFASSFADHQLTSLGLSPLTGLPALLQSWLTVSDAVANLWPERPKPIVESYLAPRLAAVMALRGEAVSAEMTLALRLARGSRHAQYDMFNEVYAACIESLLADHNLSVWSSRP
jgi:hypothetical protein